MEVDINQFLDLITSSFIAALAEGLHSGLHFKSLSNMALAKIKVTLNQSEY